MNPRQLLTNKWFHSFVVTVFVVIALVPSLQETMPEIRYVTALGLIAVWVLGQRYERAIILEAGLLEEEELTDVERRSGSIWSR